MMQCFKIDMPPVAKQRPRIGNGRAYTPEKTKDAEQTLQFLLCAMKPKKLEGPVRLTAKFLIERPKRCRSSFPDRRPDLDNYVKLVMDACNGFLWQDDAQVVELYASKVYSDKAAIIITVEQVDA